MSIMRSLPRLGCALLLSITLASVVAHLKASPQARPAAARIEVLFSRDVRAEPVTGMVYVAISRDNRRPPIEQTAPTGVPLFSHFVEQLAPGSATAITGDDRGHPVRSLRDLPAGEYWMQPFVNVYTRFPRADGHTVWLHNDQWEGQNWKRSPGNLFGDPVRVTFDPTSLTSIRLTADKVIPPVQVPADTAMVKRIRFQSAILSRWWGQPIYLGATVLLPKGYDTHPDARYPVNYMQDHFSLNPPGGFGRGGDFDRFWMSDTAPRFIAVTLQHPSPYYDDSYGVDSENNGPYGEAIIKELIPAVEQKFRVIREPWARMLSGGSTGGWIALAHQVLYPDFYGGSFALCPDSVDFTYHQIVNIYSDANAYYLDKGWTIVERPSERKIDGNIDAMMKDENWYELVVGDKSRSGGQWDIWEATYSPVGPDGYPQRLWNKETGVIDKSVAEQWKKYDMADIIRKNWTVLGPKIANKLHIYVGDMDTYYLNDAVEKLNEFLAKADDPKFAGEVVFQRRAPHCWGPRGAELWQKLAAQVEKNAPAGATKSWRY
jgi:putative esterase